MTARTDPPWLARKAARVTLALALLAGLASCDPSRRGGNPRAAAPDCFVGFVAGAWPSSEIWQIRRAGQLQIAEAADYLRHDDVLRAPERPDSRITLVAFRRDGLSENIVVNAHKLGESREYALRGHPDLTDCRAPGANQFTRVNNRILTDLFWQRTVYRLIGALYPSGITPPKADPEPAAPPS